jgi:glycogen phosphorylase
MSDGTRATSRAMQSPGSAESGVVSKRLRHCGCDAYEFAGSGNALYERHLVFDNIVDPAAIDERERFEAFARAVRDVLSQRWLKTGDAYARQNPKHVYYLSMEFLIGRSLANNVTNLLLGPIVKKAIKDDDIDWVSLLDREPDAGLGNGGLGRLAACFLDSMATMQIPAIGYGLRYEYGMFKQIIQDGWQQEQPDNWLRRPDPWEVARPHEKVVLKLNSTFEIREGRLHAIAGRPSTLFGIPYDRPVAGYGGKTINTLRLWAACAPDYFDSQVFSHGDFVGAVAETLVANSLTRVLYPDDSTSSGQELRFVQEYFLVACSLADLVRRFRRGNDDWNMLPEKAAIQLNDTHPALAVPELMRILLDDANLGWDHAWDLTQRTLGYTNHTLLPEALEKWPLAWFEELLPHHLEIVYEINRRLLASVRTRFPGDEERAQRVSLIEEGPAQHVRMANLAIVGSHKHEWRGRNSHRAPAQDNGQGFGGNVSRAFQQQNERRYAPPMAVAGQPGPRPHDYRGHRRRLGNRPESTEQAGAASRRQGASVTALRMLNNKPSLSLQVGLSLHSARPSTRKQSSTARSHARHLQKSIICLK